MTFDIIKLCNKICEHEITFSNNRINIILFM